MTTIATENDKEKIGRVTLQWGLYKLYEELEEINKTLEKIAERMKYQ